MLSLCVLVPPCGVCMYVGCVCMWCSHAVESQKRSTEALAAQREAEAQYLQLQAEHAQLHDMLKVRGRPIEPSNG